MAKLLAAPKRKMPGIRGILGIWDEIIGADPDPYNPGYLTDGTPDPNYYGGGGMPLPLATTYDPATDPDLIALGPIPPTRGEPLPKSEAAKFWDKMPEDGIAYDNGVLPGGTFYSYNLAYNNSDGFFWNGAKWIARRGNNDKEATDEEKADIA